MASDHACRDSHVWADGCLEECECGRGTYCADEYSSCYLCFLDRRADLIACIFCDKWHSPEFDTCYECRPQGRDEAAQDLKRVILARDSFRCRYCSTGEGDPQLDPRLVRPKCPPSCATEHNHRWPCKPDCGKRHRCRTAEDPRTCKPGCYAEHNHLIKDDDGIRPARLHIDHIRPCAKDGTADPWNLQILCGVCNIAKGSDWIPGSRHDRARRLVMAAYLTYLWPFLDAGQQEDLSCDAHFDGLTYAEAAELVKADYIGRVKAARS
jgi:hypothetical protein